ncbi:MAG: hypothetical protein O7B81_01720 [Gammaproteobacteria bacterium]|nr:hypothetical protein [Gammaproteobacteria bacterium]
MKIVRGRRWRLLRKAGAIGNGCTGSKAKGWVLKTTWNVIGEQ